MLPVITSKLTPLYLGVPFIALYFFLRALPVEPCDFLHEETYNLEGELDYCGPGDAGFIDLSVRRWPMSLDFRPLDRLEIGKPCRFELNIKQADGSPLADKDVALSHTRKIHLLAIDLSMEDYQHLHPEPDPLFDGIWRFTLTPKRAGNYQVYLDLIPLRSPRRVLLGASFVVPGERIAPVSRTDGSVFRIGKRTYHLDTMPNEKEGSEIFFKFSAKDENGESLPLKPVMGAFAHMVAFDSTKDGFAHLHPLEFEPPKSTEDAWVGPLTFSFKSPSSGQYRFWAQVKVGEDQKESFLPFDLKI